MTLEDLVSREEYAHFGGALLAFGLFLQISVFGVTVVRLARFLDPQRRGLLQSGIEPG